MNAGTRQRVDQIAAVMLLAGGVSPSPLMVATGRPSIALPVAPGFSLLDCWIEQVSRLGKTKLRVLVDGSSMAPVADGRFEVCRDCSEFRGAGGALRDATLDLREDAYVLAAPASQVVAGGLDEMVAQLAARAGDAVLGVNGDGTPGSVLLARVGALRKIQDVGFVDLKEQALPMLAKTGTVRALRFADRPALSARTPAEYIAALRRLAGGTEEVWNAVFSVVESGAEVAQDVTLHDSVVLRGAKVGSGAVLVRCLVCDGAVVAPGAVCVDQLFKPETRGGNAKRVASHASLSRIRAGKVAA